MKRRDTRQKRGAGDFFYTPLAVELEITTRCALHCRHCGIYNEIGGEPKDLSVPEVLDILKQAKEAGIKGYCMTGGDPLLRLGDVCKIISAAVLDLCKLAVTGVLFSTENKTRDILHKLKDAGIARRNRELTPFFSICIGMQNLAGLPMKNIAIFTKVCLGVFPKNIRIQLNASEPEGCDAEPFFQELDREYRSLTGFGYPFDLVKGVIYDMCEIPGQDNEAAFNPQRITVEEFIKKGGPASLCRNFDPIAIPYYFPRCLISSDGSVYPCSCCYKIACAGNIKNEGFKTILDGINADAVLRTIVTEGFMAFYNKKLAEDPSVAEKLIPVSSSICAVCALLRERS